MASHRQLPRLFSALLVAALALAAASCQQGADEAEPDTSAVFGNGFADPSPVICKVGDLEITQRQLDLRYEELPRELKSRFSGPGWEKRFLRYMVDEALLYREARQRHLGNDPAVSQQLISARRNILRDAIENKDLVKNLQPTEEEVLKYYQRNKEKYVQLGTMRARHIQCSDRERANQAYDRIRSGKGRESHFAWVASEFSNNPESLKQAGDLGWFNRSGFIPALPYGKEFSETIWDWDKGLHEPAWIGDHWHVVEILSREYERPLTVAEARDRIVRELGPILEEEAVEAFLRQAKQETPVDYFGSYRPGEGMDPRQLFERAWYAPTPEQKIDLYKLIIEDYPTSDMADDALFMLGNLYLDTWGDTTFAGRYLDRLLEYFPDSEYAEDARYILENMGSPEFVSPTSVEDLRRRQR